MATDLKLPQGTAAWFEMAGNIMRDAAAQCDLPRDLNVSMVERYTDGVELSDGLVQGLRFDIAGGEPSFRVGASDGEQADIIVEITAAAARTLNLLHAADLAYRAARDTFMRTGEMRVQGDPTKLGDWLDAVHDPIVDRTC